MKTRLFTIALLLAATLSGFAQDKNSLQAATLKMINLTDLENYYDLTGTVYPKVYNMVSKDEYLEQQQKKMKGKDYTIHMMRIEPSIDYGAIKSSENGVYCLINYDRSMKIELEEKVAENDRKAKEDFFKKLLGTEEVYYNTSDNTIDVKERVQVVALADEGSYGQWTFIETKSPYAMQVLPEAVRNELAENGELPAENTPTGVEAEAAKHKAEKEAILKNKKS